jgi:catechol 2,3-dioxygenase-like lactoylglutathione lyase family enzyme
MEMSLSPPIGEVEHVCVAMEDLLAARELFAKKLRLPVVDYDEGGGECFAVRAGGTTLRIVDREAPETALGRRGVNHIALRVGSLGAAAARLADLGFRQAETSPPSSGGRNAVWLDPVQTSGIPIQLVEQSAPLKFPPSHVDGFIERVDHLGVACHSQVEARSAFIDKMGFEVECTQIDSEVLVPVETTSNDKYGATSHARAPIPAVGSGLMALFVTVGDLDLEIMQPLGAANVTVPLGSVPGTVGQDHGAIARFLEKRGEGLLHICFKTPDIKRALESVSAAGIGLIDPVARPGGRAGLIAFMDRRDTEGVLMHFVERTPL